MKGASIQRYMRFGRSELRGLGVSPRKGDSKERVSVLLEQRFAWLGSLVATKLGLRMGFVSSMH